MKLDRVVDLRLGIKPAASWPGAAVNRTRTIAESSSTSPTLTPLPRKSWACNKATGPTNIPQPNITLKLVRKLNLNIFFSKGSEVGRANVRQPGYSGEAVFFFFVFTGRLSTAGR
jgi:hypothetical protein